MMRGFRDAPPTTLAGEEVVEIIDFQTGEVRSPQGVLLSKVSQASSNVMQFVTAKGSRITARPSGTEPKIKCYVSVREDWDGQDSHAAVMARLQAQIEAHFLALGVSGR
jgi:phosphoglucomutase